MYAAGIFGTAGGVSAIRVAKWNGAAWSALGSGLNSTVYALAVSSTEDLYAGGSFTASGVVPINYVAKWDGSAWSALGTGMNDFVFGLAVSGSDLYAGGQFITAGGVSANRIAKWDGSAWLPLGSGMNSSVLSLAVSSGGDVYAGGLFTAAGGASAGSIAKWNGSTWSPLGSGVSGFSSSWVTALAVSGSDLYVGGQFLVAGDKVSAFAAKALLPTPVAHNATYARAPGLSLKIRFSDIASDLNGLPLTVSSLGASAQGATLSSDSTYIYYRPANNNADSFTYTVSNGSATDTATITVTVAAPGGLAKTVAVFGGLATVKFFGIPGFTCDVQRTTSLTPPVNWTTLTTGSPLSPGTDGSFTYLDGSAPGATAYYRSLQH